MMVPRAYLYTEEKSRKRSMGALTVPRPRSTPPEVIPATVSKDPEKGQLGWKSPPRSVPVPERTISEPVSIPTAPMLVQPRFHPASRSLSPSPQTLNMRGQYGRRASGRKLSEKHDPNALPPAVAALLAVTAIPPPTSLQRRRKPSTQRRISIDELVQEWKQEGSPSQGSPLDILLEPCEETDAEEDSIFNDVDDEKEATLLLSSRSVSSDSIDSMPSLDAGRSTVSNSSMPSTPSYRRRAISIRTEKIVALPPAERCLDDHPLRSPSPANSEITIMPHFPPRPKRVLKQKSTFKSNLTAGFSALKTAARSFSNFTAPSIPQEDLLTRSLFSSPYPPEMRPKSSDGIADPALRRYLNPAQGVHISSDAFSLQIQEALAQPTTDADDTPLIQMQTYSRRKKPRTRGASVGPDRGEAVVLGQDVPTVRQREPRENGDFLRTIVCEMNMRRNGKLDAKAQFRARIWLPPRKGGAGEEVHVREGKEVPVRWIGISMDEV